MDAEKFDKVVLDLLYDELDELTRASAIRHTEQSGRAKALYAELRATREVGALPLVEPPDDLEERIMQAEERARAERPLGQRLGALVSIAASYAMRPQLAMAAVLMLMVGSSLLFLRVKPGAPSSVQVTERGVPESEKESVTVPVTPMPAAPEDFRTVQPTEAPRQARGRMDAPKPEFAPSPAPVAQADKTPQGNTEAEPAATQAANLPSLDEAPLAAAEGLGSAASGPSAGAGATATAGKDDDGTAGAAAGCESDLPRYEAIMAAPSTTSAEALGAARAAAAECYRRLGRIEKARLAYQLLLKDPRYADDARRALSNLPETNSRVAETTTRAAGAPHAARAPAKAAAKPAAPAAAPKPSP